MSWVERAYVGQKIVCIKYSDVAGHEGAKNCEMAVDGAVYTIRELATYNGSVGLLLVEIHNPVCNWRHGETEFLFHPSRFCPVRDTTLQVEAIKRAALDVPAKPPETVA